MNYYERHIGDYIKDTAHLSLLEHGIYTRLLDVYYSRESAIPPGQAARLIGARSREEIAALDRVIKEFFLECEVGGDLIHTRCEKEINRYSEKRAKAKASADARWKNDKPHTERNANACQAQCDGNAPNHQTPITSNQPSSKATGKRKAPSFVLPDWVDAQAWGDFEAMRKAQRKPMTDAARRLALSNLAELRDSGQDPADVLRQSTFRCWSGLFPVKSDTAPAVRAHGLLNRQEAIEAQNRAVGEEWLRQQEGNDATR